MDCRPCTKSQKCQKLKVRIQDAHTLPNIEGSTKHFLQNDGRHSSGMIISKLCKSKHYQSPASMNEVQRCDMQPDLFLIDCHNVAALGSPFENML